LLIYTWVSFMYPHMLAWSFAQTFPAAKAAAISFIGGALITQSGDSAPLRTREMVAMIAFWMTFTVSSVFAFYRAGGWIRWKDDTKIIALALMSATFITSRARMKWFLLVIGLSLGFYGIKGGIFSIVGGGENMVWGPGTSILGA